MSDIEMVDDNARVSAIDTHTVAVSLFDDLYARSLQQRELTLPQLAELIKGTSAADKEALPQLKMMLFGDRRSDVGCLRTNDNAIALTGVEVELDAGKVTFDEAVAVIRKNRLRALLYTTPSHALSRERWRILLPLSETFPMPPLDPPARAQLVAALNGLFNDQITVESFTLSLAFRYGHIKDMFYRVEVLDGDFINLRDDISKGMLYKHQRAPAVRVPPMPEWMRELLADDKGMGTSLAPSDNLPPLDIEELHAALAVISPGIDRKSWINIGTALCNELGDAEGFEWWDQWSSRSEKYKIREMASQWRSIVRGEYSVNVATIFWHANQADPNWRERYRAARDAQIATDEQAQPSRPPPVQQAQPSAAASVQQSKTAARNTTLISGGDFATNFAAPDYLVYKLLQRRNLYSFTGMTGHGKTAIALLIAVHVALGRSIGGMETEQGRVLYCAGENPDDVRMRWIRMCEVMNLDPYAVDIHFLEGAQNLSETQLRQRIINEVHLLGGMALIVVDTSAAYFVADPKNDDENDAVLMLKHAKMLRSLTLLTGRPTVLVPAHPTKSADLSNLLPRGGGAFLNEMDGNLVAIREDRTSPLIKVDWHGKFRGPEFNPFSFKLVSSPLAGMKDSRGRDIWTVYAEPIGDVEEAKIEHAFHDRGLQLLQTMTMRPGVSIAVWAETLGWLSADNKPQSSTIHRLLKVLLRAKKVEKDGPHYKVTRKGKKALEEAASTGLQADDPGIPF